KPATLARCSWDQARASRRFFSVAGSIFISCSMAFPCILKGRPLSRKSQPGDTTASRHFPASPLNAGLNLVRGRLQAVLGLDPLAHVAGALVLVVTQHAAGEVVAPMRFKLTAAFLDARKQGSANAFGRITLLDQLQTLGLRLLPGERIAVQAHGLGGDLGGAAGD